MAVYIDLAIDCGTDEHLANRLQEYFNKVTLEIPQESSVSCKTFKEYKRSLWFVSVWPEGMGYGTHPVCRPELASKINKPLIQTILYDHLKHIAGFRRALFSGEAYDDISNATIEDDDIDCIDMIFLSTAFPQPAKNLILTPFSEGYLMVVGRNEGSLISITTQEDKKPLESNSKQFFPYCL